MLITKSYPNNLNSTILSMANFSHSHLTLPTINSFVSGVDWEIGMYRCWFLTRFCLGFLIFFIYISCPPQALQSSTFLVYVDDNRLCHQFSLLLHNLGQLNEAFNIDISHP